MSRSVIIIATLALITPVLAADPPKSGSFKTASAFKAVEETTSVGDKHTLSHGTAWGVVTDDNPLRIKTAMCPYISEVNGDTISFNGRCAWSDADGDKIFTEWTSKMTFAGGDGAQPFTGGSGKFSGIQGSNPFQCQIVGKEGQFTCTQQWTYQLPSK
jgi:hypothetical protein